jgi:hypothetical protein
LSEITNDNAAERLSLRRLQQLATQLPPRDLEILRDLEERRYMTSGQIVRKHFTGASNDASAQRSANTVINRLHQHGLILSLPRRIGGVRGGSKGFVWSLTTSGYRLLHLDGEELPRRRAFEPSPRFVEHTLALSELDLQLRGIGGVTVTEIQLEPACWRDCNGVKLKPDMFAVTGDGEYDDHWFFELDLATETPAQITDKCRQYQNYYRSNTEQRKFGVFPLVVWIVPSERRKASLREHIGQCAELQHKTLFTVILPDELESLVRKGAGV